MVQSGQEPQRNRGVMANYAAGGSQGSSPLQQGGAGRVSRSTPVGFHITMETLVSCGVSSEGSLICWFLSWCDLHFKKG